MTATRQGRGGTGNRGRGDSPLAKECGERHAVSVAAGAARREYGRQVGIDQMSPSASPRGAAYALPGRGSKGMVTPITRAGHSSDDWRRSGPASLRLRPGRQLRSG